MGKAWTSTTSRDVFNSHKSESDPPETARAGPPKIPPNARHTSNIRMFPTHAKPRMKKRKISKVTR